MSSALTPSQSTESEQSWQSTVRSELTQRSDASSPAAQFFAMATASRQLLQERWAITQQQDAKSEHRRVHYLSMEFLMGRALSNALTALNLNEAAKQFINKDALLEQALASEPDAALGNGGLGRLAACFLDAFANLGLPSFGYGLRYEHGMFKQIIKNCKQTEVPEDWLRTANPWEVERAEFFYPVGFGGQVAAEGNSRRWIPAETINAHAIDFIVPGHNTEHVSTLRQWQARAALSLDLKAFSKGDYVLATEGILPAQTLNWILYPDDSTDKGRELRLRQEYLLVSASVQDMLARHCREHGSVTSFGQKNVIHLNDTHPALSPIELMRLLLDVHQLTWDEAWKITREATSYTNHTLMPEALETWSVRMFEQQLPRHLEIIYEINQRFLENARKRYPSDEERSKKLSLIDEAGERRVRMAAIAVLASSKVNGVSALHSKLMVETIFSQYAELWPERFLNVTNGVTHRRWLEQANPRLSSLLDNTIGQIWRKDLTKLTTLREYANNANFTKQLQAVKLENKAKLAQLIHTQLGLVVNPANLFDVQIKRIHEYKRQLLNVLHVIARYQAILAAPNLDWQPRVVVFAGKAASSYYMAKLIIELIHDVARVINADPTIGERLKLVFIPNYGVSLGEVIFPAADLSEQISTAGTEASGTGNMKFALNGALTIGTWDGANIEMAEAIGEDNMFVFGLRTEQVARIKAQGYEPKKYVESNQHLKAVLAAINDGTFSAGEPSRYHPLTQALIERDQYFLMADFTDYVRAQASVDALYKDAAAWQTRATLNIAGMGYFSADRTIKEYSELIWAKSPSV